MVGDENDNLHLKTADVMIPLQLVPLVEILLFVDDMVLIEKLTKKLATISIIKHLSKWFYTTVR